MSLRPHRPSSARPPGIITRHLQGRGWQCLLDLTPQVLSLAIPDETKWTEDDEELAPTCGGLTDGFVSASMLAVKAKLFDDGLFAAVEIAAQPVKEKMLAALSGAGPTIAAAAAIGANKSPQSRDAQRIAAQFLADAPASKPLGFYTWSRELQRIFQQDRLLQQPLEPQEAAAAADALAAEPGTRLSYAAYLDAMARLTNPPPSGKNDLRHVGGQFLFPPARSLETDLVERLYAGRAIPDGFSLADEVIRRVRDKSIDLTPTGRSGWYDFQSWALEPLIAPERMREATRLRMNEAYQRQLQELCKATLSLTRETHAKRLHIPCPGAALGRREPKVVVRAAPELAVEPVVTYYERRAQGYEFVRGVLESLGTLRFMHRLTPEGPVARPLDEELEEIAGVFRGAAAVAAHDLGLELANESEAAQFRVWAKSPDVGGDIRMMVPVFFDVGRQQTKVWAILGWATRSLVVSFAAPPTAHVLAGQVRVEFGPALKRIAYPVFWEGYVRTVLAPREFRAHCDRHRSGSRIVRAL